MNQANDEDVSCRSRKQDFTCTGPCTVRAFLSISARFSLHDERGEQGLLFTHSKKWNAKWTWRTQPWPQIARRDFTDPGHWIWAMKLAGWGGHPVAHSVLGNYGQQVTRNSWSCKACKRWPQRMRNRKRFFPRNSKISHCPQTPAPLGEKRVWPIVERLKTFVRPCQVISHPINFFSVASLFVPSKVMGHIPKNGQSFDLRVPDDYQYTVSETIGEGTYGEVLGATRSDGKKASQSWSPGLVDLEKTIFRSLGPQRPLGLQEHISKTFSLVNRNDGRSDRSSFPIVRQPKDSCWKLRRKHELAAHETVLEMESDASFLLFCTIWTVIFVHESRQLWRWVWCIGL